MSTTPIIYIVDDYKDQLEIAAKMLTLAGYTVVTYDSGLDFLEEKEFDDFSCLLLDNQMPGISGLDVQKELGRRNIDIPIVFMSGDSSYSDVVGAVKNGALGFLQKPFTLDELIEQVSKAVDESQRRLDIRLREKKTQNLLASLTPRESEVYELVINGHTNKSISESLSVTIGTVEFHRANLMEKLGARTLADLMLISHRTQS